MLLCNIIETVIFTCKCIVPKHVGRWTEKNLAQFYGIFSCSTNLIWALIDETSIWLTELQAWYIWSVFKYILHFPIPTLKVYQLMKKTIYQFGASETLLWNYLHQERSNKQKLESKNVLVLKYVMNFMTLFI